MKVQEYLRSGKTLEDLKKEYAIKITESPNFPLIILNYCQINSPRFEILARECRGLVLERDTWEVVARSFIRFFNYGEYPEIDNSFNWNDFVCLEKHDGSLLSLFWYKDRWLLTTKGSFANGKPCDLIDKTWEELFYEQIDEKELDSLDKNNTYVFEYCSRYNKVVRDYPEPELYLLDIKNNVCYKKYTDEYLLNVANLLNVKVPKKFNLSTIFDINKFIKNAPTSEGPTFEGLVLKDSNGLMIKVKSQSYVSLHHLKNNVSKNNVLKFILSKTGEQYELLNYFPEMKPFYEDVTIKIELCKSFLVKEWLTLGEIKNQKEFALAINNHKNELVRKFSSLFFKAKKMGVAPIDFWEQEAEKFLLKVI